MSSTKLLEIYKEAGVEDLPIKARGKFAQAIRAERQGDSVKAEQLLDAAVAAL